MSRRNKVIIIAIIVIIGVVIAIVLGDKFFTTPAELTPEGQNLQNQQQPDDQTLPGGMQLQQQPTEPVEVINPVQLSLVNTARNFAERYGSYSTDSNFANLEELKLFSSANMAQKLNTTINSGYQAEEFYGVTSKALNVEIEQLNEAQGPSLAIVSLQRQETQINGATRVYYQDLELTLIKSGNDWLVDEAEWLK